jgi:hypothetical protein
MIIREFFVLSYETKNKYKQVDDVKILGLKRGGGIGSTGIK